MNTKLKIILKLLRLYRGNDVSKILNSFNKIVTSLEKARSELVQDAIAADQQIENLRTQRAEIDAGIAQAEKAAANIKSLIDGPNG